jgi:membrane peptidoglycan carboxypeptidase
MLSQNILVPAGGSWRGPSGLKKPFYQRWWFKLGFSLLILGCLAAVAAWYLYVIPLKEKADTFNLAEIPKLEVSSIIYDRKGREFGRLHMTNRTTIKFKDVPQHFKDALIAQEDSRFYEHEGVDWYGVGRAVVEGVKRLISKQGVNQGASTITQQLGRQTFQLLERELSRKIVEWFLAMRIEKAYSKQEIMEHYLNRIFFGSGNGQNFYGVESAAKGYFGKSVGQLTLDESATMVGLIKAPNNYSPLKHPDAAIRGRNIVLDRMLEERMITSAVAEENKRKPMITVAPGENTQLTYVFDAIRQQAIAIVGEERALVGGFHIYTSLDADLQRQTDEAVRKRLTEVEGMQGYGHQSYAEYKQIVADYKRRLGSKKADGIDPNTPKPNPKYLQGAALVVDNDTGAILALSGGRDFRDNQYNRALDSARAVGTAFTPFVYAHAFSTPAFFPGSPLEDAPADNRMAMLGGAMEGWLGEWGTESMDSTWSLAKITAREAMVTGKNGATVRLAYQAFPGANPDVPNMKPLQELAARAGIQSPIKEAPASFLGASEVKLNEMCLAYTSFPNQGQRPANLTLVMKIADLSGNTVFQAKMDEPKVRVMDDIAAYQTHSCMVDVLERGTGKAARAEFGLKNFPAAGKTGTHADYKDLWFMGYTPRVTCGVWVGFDRATTIAQPPNSFSSRIALPIWCDIMNSAQTNYAGGDFSPPVGVEKLELCKHSGMRVTDFCYEKMQGKTANGVVVERSVRSSYTEYVRPGTTVSSVCSVHTGATDASGTATGTMATVTLDDFSANLNADPSAGPAATGRFSSIEPVHMQAATILGEDPFESIIPVPRARPVNPDGVEIKRPEIIEDQLPAMQLPVQITPPKPAKIMPD